MTKIAMGVLGGLVLGLAACAGTAHRPVGGVTAAQQFEKLKTLEGTWVSAEDSEMPGTIEYHVIGGGSSLQETLFRGTPHEMVTMYHLDGDQLMLTHYCAAGNQPTMRAQPAADLSEIRFDFLRLSNGDPRKDMHMHDAVLNIGDDGHLRAAWASWEGGKPSEFTARMDMIRAQ